MQEEIEVTMRKSRRGSEPEGHIACGRLALLLVPFAAFIMLFTACAAEVTVSDTVLPAAADTTEPATETAAGDSTPVEEDAMDEDDPGEGAGTQATDAEPEEANEAAPLAPVCGSYVVEEDRYLDQFELGSCDQPHDSELAGEYVDIGGGDSVRTPESDVARAEGCGAVVAALTGRPAATTGVDIGIDENRADGADVIYDCWVRLSAPDSLTGSLTEAPIEDLLAEGLVLLADFPPGDCYDYAAEESFDLVIEVDCDKPVAQGHAGVVELVGDSTAYDEGAVVEQAFAACDDAYGLDYNSITYPDERGWTVGQRSVYCTYDYAWAAAE